jgi:acetyl-CoA carboxylase biotin carboxyl carrier protein
LKDKNNRKIDYEEISKLVSFLEEKQLTEFELEVEGFKIKISRAVTQPVTQVQPVSPNPGTQPEQAEPQAPAAPPVSQAPEEFHYVTSPMVGTFYRAPNPSSPSFVEIGEEVKKGQTLCIIEAMKLMNEIESDADGVVLEIYVENGKPVEYGQRLFAIQPAAA